MEGYLVYYFNGEYEWSKRCDTDDCIEIIMKKIKKYIPEFKYEQINWKTKGNDEEFIISFFGIEHHKWRFISLGG